MHPVNKTHAADDHDVASSRVCTVQIAAARRAFARANCELNTGVVQLVRLARLSTPSDLPNIISLLF